MNSNSESRFGKYSVVQKIGAGGMAEVFKCRLTGIGGFDKTLVVKRIKPELLGEPEFIKMFLDEARLAAFLDHQNIVQVFEVDQYEGVPYIAMEYVRGPTLFALLRRAKAAQRLDAGHAAKILSGVCEGLHHAHSACDGEGLPLHIVHRDVSPHNVIISYEGIPKLLDFGVARAAGRQTSTDAGTLKGKLRYMAPEQLRGGVVDGRADVFGVGVCLLEATTGEPPYLTKTDPEVIHDVFKGISALPEHFPEGYPQRLEQILRWATDPELERRCPSCFELHAALEEFVAEGDHASSQKGVAAWLAELFIGPAGESMPGLYGLSPSRSVGGRSQSASFRRPAAAALVTARGGAGCAPAAAQAAANGFAASPVMREAAPETPAAAGEPPSEPGAVPASGVGAPAAESKAPNGATQDGSGKDLSAPESGSVAEGSLASADSWEAAAVGAIARARRRRILVGIGVAAAAVAGLALASLRGRVATASHESAAAPDSKPSEDDAAAQAYLREIEQLAAARRFGPALELLGKVRALHVTDAAINIRASRLGDDLERGALLFRAQKQLAAGEFRAAQELAQLVLDRDPDNARAAQLLAQAREAKAEAAAPRPKVEPKGLDGKISVSSEPAGTAYVDDEPTGRSPIRGRAVKEGRHLIQVRAEGHANYDRTADIAPGKELAVATNLAPASLRPRPELAEPSEGNELSSSASARGELPAPKAEPTAASPSPGPALAASSAVDDSAAARSIRKPRLPARHSVASTKELMRALQLIENEAVAGGASADVARDVTFPLSQELSKRIGPSEPVQIYPRAVYYFIVSMAAQGASGSAIAAQLRSAQLSGQLAARADR